MAIAKRGTRTKLYGSSTRLRQGLEAAIKFDLSYPLSRSEKEKLRSIDWPNGLHGNCNNQNGSRRR